LFDFHINDVCSPAIAVLQSELAVAKERNSKLTHEMDVLQKDAADDITEVH
jgi:hypothetical protein